jgi:hypothetical protein
MSPSDAAGPDRAAPWAITAKPTQFAFRHDTRDVTTCPDCQREELRRKSRFLRMVLHESWGMPHYWLILEAHKWLCGGRPVPDTRRSDLEFFAAPFGNSGESTPDVVEGRNEPRHGSQPKMRPSSESLRKLTRHRR